MPKRECADCERPVLVKNTARESTNWETGITTYRCKDCQKKRIAEFIEMNRRLLGLTGP